jgi:hypothetical protein
VRYLASVPPFRRTVVVAAAVVAYALWCWSLFAAAQTWLPNSDNSSAVLFGWSQLHGNLVLSGWKLGADPFWTSEAPLFALADAVFGPSRIVVAVVATSVWAALGAAVAFLASRAAAPGRRPLAAVLGFTVMAAPVVGLLEGPIHVGTALFCVVGLALTWEGAQRHPAFGVGAAIVLAAGAAGDPLAYLVAIAPLLVVGAVMALRTRTPASAVPVATAVAALLLALGATWLAQQLHGFESFAVPGRVHIQRHTLVATLASLGDLLYVRLLPTSWGGALLWAGRMALLALTVAGVVLARRRLDWLAWVLALGLALDVAGVAFYSTDPAAAGRRLVPAFAFAGALAGRFAADALPARRIWSGAAAVLAVVSVLPVILSNASLPVPPDRHVELVAWLDQHRLTRGYGDYWDSNVVTVDSGGRVTVRPVIASGGRVVPFAFNVDSGWYRPAAAPVTFLVFSPDGPPVDATSAANTFGPPASTYQVAGYFTVLVWRSDLAVKL